MCWSGINRLYAVRGGGGGRRLLQFGGEGGCCSSGGKEVAAVQGGREVAAVQGGREVAALRDIPGWNFVCNTQEPLAWVVRHSCVPFQVDIKLGHLVSRRGTSLASYQNSLAQSPYQRGLA